jgi:hypothetical protein
MGFEELGLFAFTSVRNSCPVSSLSSSLPEKPDFSDPKQFQKCFFLQIFIQKSTTHTECILLLPSGCSKCTHLFDPLQLANVFSALSKHLFLSSFHCSFQARESFEEGRAF